MQNTDARGLYNALATYLDSKHPTLSAAIEAVEMLASELDDRNAVAHDGNLSWAPEIPTNSVDYEDEVLCLE